MTGGKTKKKLRKNKKNNNKSRKNKRSLKNKRNSKNKKTKRGGAKLFRNILGTVLNVGAKPDELPNNDLIQQREENPKKVKDFIKMVKGKEIKKIKPQEVTITSIPTNLSEVPECEGKKLNIEIERASNDFKEFIRNHDKIKQHYSKYNKFFFDYITKNIIKTNENGRYEIMSIDSNSLNTIEKEVRKNLVEYYTTCHQLFNESFYLLVTGVQKSGITKIVETPENNNDENNNNRENQNQNNNNNNSNTNPKAQKTNKKTENRNTQSDERNGNNEANVRNGNNEANVRNGNNEANGRNGNNNERNRRN